MSRPTEDPSPALRPGLGLRDLLAVVDLARERTAAHVAIRLAAAFDAHVTGLALAFDLPGLALQLAPLPAEVVIEARRAAIDEARGAARDFATAAAGAGVRYAVEAAEGLALEGFDPVVGPARLADLVVVGEAGPDRPEPLRESLVEALLFQAGAPVMLIPPRSATPVPPDRVLIAWDGSTPAARALRAAMPLLARAAAVDVVTVGEATESAGTDVVAHLHRHGIAANRRAVDGAGGVSQVLIESAVEARAGLMVMGAYGHNRLRERVLGGTSRDLLATPPVPLLLAH